MFSLLLTCLLLLVATLSLGLYRLRGESERRDEQRARAEQDR